MKFYQVLLFLLSFSFFSQTSFSQTVDEIVVTGHSGCDCPYFDPFGMPNSMPDTGTAEKYHVTEAAYAAQRGQQEALQRKKKYDDCMSDSGASSKLLECQKQAYTDLNSFQQICAYTTAGAAAVTLAGGYLTKDASNWRFKAAGSVLVVTGTLLGAGAKQCYDTASNQKGVDDLKCQSDFNEVKKQCSASSGFTPAQ